MSLRRISIVTIFLFLFSLVMTRIWQDDKLYSWGHPGVVDVSILSLLILLTVTHTLLLVIMWLQRDKWLHSEAAMFRSISVKAIFWGNATTKFYLGTTTGITPDAVLMFVALLVSTIDLDIRLVGRYILGWEDSDMFPDREDE